MLSRPNPREIDRKRRLALPHQPVPKQEPGERTHNFDEVYLPYDEEAAITESMRCIQCPAAPCVKACPLHNDIPLALWQIEHGLFDDAATVFRRTSTMSEVCGRVCPQSIQCEGACVYVKKGEPPVAIGRLEVFAADYQSARGGRDVRVAAPTGRKVAVVGAGPAGLTVAQLLAKRGHAITVFDLWPTGGGILRYGIPQFKMDHEVVAEQVAYTAGLGVQFVYNTKVGRDLTLDSLFEDGIEAVFLGIGAGVAADPGLPGQELNGVHNATPFLIRANVDEAVRPDALAGPLVVGPRVVVIGGGDTAMDCLRTAVRLGGEDVVCLYRRTEAEMPGNERDRALAKEEGIAFQWLTQPLRFIGDESGGLRAMECIRTELGEADESGRRRPVPIEGSAFTLPVDTAVLALGYRPDPLIGETTAGLDTHNRGLFAVDDRTGATSRPGVFAGGDDVVGPDLVVTAVAHGQRAAEAMHEYLMSR